MKFTIGQVWSAPKFFGLIFNFGSCSVRRLHNEELHKLDASLNVIRVM